MVHLVTGVLILWYGGYLVLHADENNSDMTVGKLVAPNPSHMPNPTPIPNPDPNLTWLLIHWRPLGSIWTQHCSLRL